MVFGSSDPGETITRVLRHPENSTDVLPRYNIASILMRESYNVRDLPGEGENVDGGGDEGR